MRFGAGLWCLQATATSPRHPAAAYAGLRQDAQLMDRLGYDAIWLSEHHFFYDGYCPSLPTAAASVLAGTDRLKVATGMMLASMRSATRVGAEVAALDAAHPGRFELGLGLGYRNVEFDGKGVDRSTRVPARSEVFEAVAAEAPGVTTWVGSALPAAVERAGRQGHGVLFSGANPMSLVTDLAAAHRRGREDGGRTGADRPRTAALRNAWVVDTAAERDAVLDWFRASYVLYAGLGWSVPQRGGTAAMDFRNEVAKALDDAVDTAIIGSADEVAAGLLAVAEAGVDDVVFRISIEGAPQEAVHEVLHRLAEEVMPVVQQEVAA